MNSSKEAASVLNSNLTRGYLLPAIGRSGLCNELFPWARAEILANHSALPIIAPNWARFRLGPYIRREPEKRRYGKLFHSSVHLHGWKRIIILLVTRKITEDTYEMGESSAKPFVVVFKGMRDHFRNLAGHRDFLRARLWEMTKPEHRPTFSKPYIAMHVRRGDQTRLGIPSTELEKRIAQFTPLRWFVSIAKEIRSISHLDKVPILVFTDGSIDEIRDLLDLPGVTKAPLASSIFDLWMLSNAKLLIASGNSTFSMWASYLGNMPTVYAPGKMQAVQSDFNGLELEISENQQIPDVVVKRVLA